MLCLSIFLNSTFSQIRETEKEALKAILIANGIENVDINNVASSENGRVVSLNLTYNSHVPKRITNIPPEIGKLASLKLLTINNNNLTRLPHEIGNLTELMWLYVNNNKLSLLPSEIGNCKVLKGIAMNNNNLTTLPPEIGNLKNLMVLSLNNNNLNNLPSEICNLSALTMAFLDSNKLCNVLSDIKIWAEKVNAGWESKQDCKTGKYLNNKMLTQDESE